MECSNLYKRLHALLARGLQRPTPDARKALCGARKANAQVYVTESSSSAYSATVPGQLAALGRPALHRYPSRYMHTSNKAVWSVRY